MVPLLLWPVTQRFEIFRSCAGEGPVLGEMQGGGVSQTLTAKSHFSIEIGGLQYTPAQRRKGIS